MFGALDTPNFDVTQALLQHGLCQTRFFSDQMWLKCALFVQYLSFHLLFAFLSLHCLLIQFKEFSIFSIISSCRGTFRR